METRVDENCSLGSAGHAAAKDGAVDQGPWIGLPDECRCRFALVEHIDLGVVLYTQMSPWRGQWDRSRRFRRALERHRKCFAERHGIDYDRTTLVPGKCESFDDVIDFAAGCEFRIGDAPRRSCN